MKFPNWQPIYKRVPVATPAAGANWSQTADRGGLWLVRGLTFTLTTSVAAGLRSVAILSTQAEDVIFGTPSATTQGPSLVRRYCAYPNSAAAGDATVVIAVGWPQDGLIVPVGCSLSSSVAVLDAADQIGSIVLDVLEFPATYPQWMVPMGSKTVYSLGDDATPEGAH